MSRTIDAGPGLLILGAVLLVVSLFLPWFDHDSAWTSFETLDLVLAGLAVAALWSASGRSGDEGRRALPIAVAALVAVAVQLLDPPPVAGAHADRGSGAWLALVATLLMTAGAALALASFSIRVDVRERERRRRVAAVDRREDPPAAPAPAEDLEQRTQPMPAVRPEADEPAP
jgi:peptidoglycan/LPS O-acetylase OafA/YrhL